MPRVMGTPSAQEIRLKVLDDRMLISGVYAISGSPPLEKKPLAVAGKWLPFNAFRLLVLAYFIVNFLDDPVVREAVIPVIVH